MSFIHENFLLTTETSARLYHEFAAQQPIIDYHNHLPPQDIAENRRFGDLYEIWLEGDHYKWRAMRANGVAEQFCTGSAANYDKYLDLKEKALEEVIVEMKAEGIIEYVGGRRSSYRITQKGRDMLC